MIVHLTARPMALVAVGLLALAVAPRLSAAEPAVSLEPRVEVVVCKGPSAALLARENSERHWRSVAPSDPVHSRDDLLALPGTRAAIASANGSATLTLAVFFFQAEDGIRYSSVMEFRRVLFR